jgi:hypothetical protein
MPKLPRKPARLPLHTSDLIGLLRLGSDATVAVTGLAEALHGTILDGIGVPGRRAPGRTSGITGWVYGAVRGGARLWGRGADALLAAGVGRQPAAASTPRREAVLAVLNGIWGDHLAATGNPLAIPSTLRIDGHALALDRASLAQRLPDASGRILVLAHGLCMNDLQWRRESYDHGRFLARELGVTPLYLHYNSGRHVSENGRDFAALLDALVAAWPVPVRDLTIVGHSMGGLVARSACHHAGRERQAWLGKLKRLVFLGTPHHGAPLERRGHQVDMLFGLSRYAAPFARLGKARSAGITDLRYGNLQDADWQGRDRFEQRHDDRRPTPLPPGVQAFLVAATTGETTDGLRGRWIGDGLVPLASALGEHADAARALQGIPPSQRLVLTRTNHWGLLAHAEVGAALARWLAVSPPPLPRP